jgi:hypothetical protein
MMSSYNPLDPRTPPPATDTAEAASIDLEEIRIRTERLERRVRIIESRLDAIRSEEENESWPTLS